MFNSESYRKAQGSEWLECSDNDRMHSHLVRNIIQ